MRIAIAIAQALLFFAQTPVFAKSYPDCERSRDASLCVASEFVDGEIRWSGILEGEKRRTGYKVYDDGDVYIGQMNEKTERRGQLLDVSRTLIYNVRIGEDGAFSRQDAGARLSGKMSCPGSYDRNIRCFDHFPVDNAGTNSDYYVGEVEEGVPNGFGYYFFEGGYYFGDFENNEFEGSGSYISFYGMKYEGEFSSDAFQGEGRLTTLDGASFVGSFKNDKKHGNGKLTRSNGKVTLGIWNDDELDSFEEFQDEAEFSSYQASQKRAIVRMQRLLVNHFYLVGQVDGIAGPSTRRAIGDAVADSGSSQRFSAEVLNLRPAEIVEPLSNFFLKEQGACESASGKWSSCFVVKK